MSQRFAWVLNLDAELELARNRAGYVPRRKLLAQLAEHGARSQDLLGPDDVSLESDGAAPTASGLVGRAWCPTPLALARLRAAGVEPEPHPDSGTLRRVNHRQFAHELGGGLPEQAYVRTATGLQEVLRSAQHPWLLKRPLSFAGRGQLRALGALTSKQWTWVEASLARDGLLVEPLVEPSLEVSVHGFVWRDGRHELGTACVQTVSERGHFRDVRRAEAGDLEARERDALFGNAERVAQALLAAGYFGPFGIDGYRYRAAWGDGFCGLSEINARYTLGFVTGFPRHPSELQL